MQELIAAIAATLTTISFIPQVLKVIKTRHTADISLSMYIIFSLGVCMWLIYGIMAGSWAIITGNAITLFLASIILFMKIRERK